MWYMNIHLYPIMFDDVPRLKSSHKVSPLDDNGKIFVGGDFAVAGTGAAYTRRNKVASTSVWSGRVHILNDLIILF